MAVPKAKTSKARRNTRRSAVWKLEMPAMSTCTNCGAIKAPHKVCKNCGFYKGVAVLKIDEE
ncbi:MAG: 50S ribosomal protein L32 [Oscillospiraceae bacterium]|nr:50S ribosomal protein L32 [Oscillospiraceae bacterium]MBR6762099.1 50S ribosomal protein L32 [Oscillospiraceae bacterium]MCQ2434911.1 50S ribosomal protein L32 [Oscillospiraceae bacterium]